MSLRDRIVVITGAARGIGLAIAQRFVAEGACVAALDRNADLLDVLAADNRDRLMRLCTDVTQQGSIDLAVTAVVAKWGGIDVLVNNAMAYTEGSVVDTTDQAWADTIDVGLTGVFRLCRAVLPAMIAKRRGCIVNIASINQIVANPGMAAYTSAKGGLHALTKQIAVEYGPQGIRCNALSPGLVLTAREREQRGDEQLRLDAECYPLGRAGLPEEVAAAALFLASDEASFITGVDLPIDGGLTAMSPAALLSPKLRARWGRAPISLPKE